MRYKPTVKSRSLKSRRRHRSSTPQVNRVALVCGLAAVVLIAAAVAGTMMSGRDNATATPAASAQLVVTARTSTDGAYALDDATRTAFADIAAAHGSIDLWKIEGNGDASSTRIDLTPRIDPDDPHSAILEVGKRADDAVRAKLSALETMMNEPALLGGRQLYAGFGHARFTNAPVFVYTQGLDLGAPDGSGLDFRVLDWDVAADRVVSELHPSATVFSGTVTYVFTPTAGDQAQLTPDAREYRASVLQALTLAMGATSVSFSDAPTATSPAADGPTSPAVEIPAGPASPHPQPGEPVAPECEVSDTAFEFGSADIGNPAAATTALGDCVGAAVASGASLVVMAWASYEGELSADGIPLHNDPANVGLTERRAAAVTSLIASIAPSIPIEQRAMGNTQLPVPADPASALNRVVRVYLIDAPTR